MEKTSNSMMLEQWDKKKNQFEEIKGISVEFYQEVDKLYFKFETLDYPTVSWKSNVTKATIQERSITWWTDSFKPPCCFRGTFDSEEELYEFISTVKEHVKPSTFVSGYNSDESLNLPCDTTLSFQQQTDDLVSCEKECEDSINCLTPGITEDDFPTGAGDNTTCLISKRKDDGCVGGEDDFSLSDKCPDNATSIFLSTFFESFGKEGCHQKKKKSIFTLTPRMRKLSHLKKINKSSKTGQRIKTKNTVTLPLALQKRIYRPFESKATIDGLGYSSFKYLLLDEDADILLLPKSLKPFRIRLADKILNPRERVIQDRLPEKRNTNENKNPCNQEKNSASKDESSDDALYSDHFAGSNLPEHHNSDATRKERETTASHKMRKFLAIVACLFLFFGFCITSYIRQNCTH